MIGSLFQPGTPAKYMSLPKSRYDFYQADAVLSEGKPVGISMDCGYMANEQVFASLATIDVAASVAPAPYVQFARSNYRDRSEDSR